MDTLLIIGLVILSADIASNLFYILFGRLVVKRWKRRVRAAEDRAKLLAEVLRQVDREDMETGRL